MPAISAYAPGKIILFGEHAVVYGRPAIAAPVKDVQARAMLQANPKGPHGVLKIRAPDIGLDSTLDELPRDHPMAAAVFAVLRELGVARPPAGNLKVTASIPPASGLGSGAAVSIAVIRALSAFLGSPLPDERVCALAFEVEKLHHGTPSGIDNTVITYGMPVFFVKGEPIETLHVPQPFTIVIGDTGVPSPTAGSVGDVRRAWQAGKARYEALFDSAGGIAEAARQSILIGLTESLGPLMDANHGILRKMGVSSPELERLVEAAREAGAPGAKLSGGGRGGNMIALAGRNNAETIASALQAAGAVRTIITQISSGGK